LAYIRQERYNIIVKDLGLSSKILPDLIPIDWHEDIEVTRTHRANYYANKKKRAGAGDKKKPKPWDKDLRAARERRGEQQE
jgi:hypothetical protein